MWPSYNTIISIKKGYMYSCVWGIDTLTYLFLVGGADLIRIDGNIKDYIKILEVCCYVIMVNQTIKTLLGFLKHINIAETIIYETIYEHLKFVQRIPEKQFFFLGLAQLFKIELLQTINHLII